MTEMNTNIEEALFDFEAPTVDHALILTYTFDPGFFGETIAPQLAQLRCERALVLMDSRQSYAMKRDPLIGGERTTIERFPNRLFHPKLYLLTSGSRYRCLIGSANCTREGWEENAELFTVFTEASGCTTGLIDFLGSIRSNLRAESSALPIISNVIDDLRAADAANHQKSPIELLFNGRMPDGTPKRIWKDIEDTLDRDPALEAWIISPFFESPEYFETGLVQKLVGERQLNVGIYFQNDAKTSRLPRGPVLQLMQQNRGKIRLFNLITNGRTLHGKLFALVGKTKVRVFSGSANFTSQGMLGENVEAGLWMTLPAQVGLNRLEALTADATVVEAGELVEPTSIPPPQPDSTLRDFIIGVRLDLRADKLTIFLDPNKIKLGDHNHPQVSLGDVTAMNVGLDIESNALVVSPVCALLTRADGTLRFPSVLVTFVSPQAVDWKYPEVSGDQLPSWGGRPRTLAIESFEDFVLFLPRRRTWSLVGGPDVIFVDPSNTAYRLELDDVEGQLDRFYRLYARAANYFEQEMQNAFATYLWRSDLVRLWRLANTDNCIGSTERGFLALELIGLLENYYLKKVQLLRRQLRSQALESVHSDEGMQSMLSEIKALFSVKDSLPEGTEPEIKRALKTLSSLQVIPEVRNGTR
jgi:hypothetical protein